MTVLRHEAMAAARKLLRTFGGAPEPRRQARAIYSTLAAASGWSLAERSAIESFGAWLTEVPLESALRPRCAELLSDLRAG